MNTKLLSGLAGFLAIIMISSCKTSADVISDRGIQKRKYNKGFYMAQKSNATKVKSIEAEADEALAVSEAENEQSLTERAAQNQTALAAVNTPSASNGSENNSAQSTPSSVAQSDVATKPSTQVIESKRRVGPSVFKIKDQSAVSTSLPMETGAVGNTDTDTLLLVILAILLPPLAVYLLRGIGTEFWISLILTLLFWLPGVIYALILILG